MSFASSDSESVEWVSAEIIRQAFNESQILQRTGRGELRRRVVDYNTHLNARQRTKMNRDHRTVVRFIKCTRSQMVLYSTLEGKPIALAHQYMRPDGELAGSGMANPKKLFLDNRILAVRNRY